MFSNNNGFIWRFIWPSMINKNWRLFYLQFYAARIFEISFKQTWPDTEVFKWDFAELKLEFFLVEMIIWKFTLLIQQYFVKLWVPLFSMFFWEFEIKNSCELWYLKHDKCNCLTCKTWHIQESTFFVYWIYKFLHFAIFTIYCTFSIQNVCICIPVYW